MIRNIKILLFILILFCSCQKEDTKEVYFNTNQVETISVENEIIDFPTEQLIAMPHMDFLDNYLLITDLKADFGKSIFIFDKNSLEFIKETGEIGEGPGEILQIGELSLSHVPKEFWIPDFSKLRVFRFNLDSILLLDEYKPTVSFPIKNDFFITRFRVIEDDFALGSGLEVFSHYEYRTSLAIWNIRTGGIEKFGEEHPKIKNEKTRCFFDYSVGNKMAALSYLDHDLLSIFDEFGEVLFHIIGETGLKIIEKDRNSYFGRVKFTDDFIIVNYENDLKFEFTPDGPRGKMPTKFLIFDLSGKLLKVIETKNNIFDFSVDEKNNRIFCHFPDREEPIGYFSIDFLVDKN